MNRLPSLSTCSILIVLLLALAMSARAQTQSRYSTDGTTSPAIAPGAPAGSFALSGFESINPFNRNLNFALPLLNIGGRGKAGYTMMLKIERKWRIENVVRPTGCGQFGCSGIERLYFQNPNWWQGIRPSYDPGALVGRVGGTSRLSPDPHTQGNVITRLTFTAADGTEYEFVDQASGGQPFWINGGCDISGCRSHSRGRVWITRDGQSATFISDTDIIETHMITQISPSGYMILRDGTRYRIDSGQVSWIRDTNGNKVTFNYSGPTTITDSLNRVVTVSRGGASPSNPDTITYKGADGATRTITIGYTKLSNALRPGYSIQTYHQLFPGLNNTMLTTPNDPNDVVSYVRLPDNRQYNFYYNSHGELARVELPTGGAIEYDWEGGIAGSGDTRDILRQVKERRTYPNGGSGTGYELRTAYSQAPSSPPASTTVEEYNNSGALISRQIHYFYGSPFWMPTSNYESPSWLLGKEYRTETYDGGGALLRVVEQTWAQRAPVSWWTGTSQDHAPSNDPRVVETATTLADVSPNLVSKQTMTYSNDAYNNVTDVYEYDFGQGGPGALIRRAHTDYLTFNNGANYAGDNNIHIRNLPIRKMIYDASGNLRSHTDFVYDNYAAFSLVARPGIVQHDGGFHTGYGARGNLTEVIQRNPGGSPSEIQLRNQYDIAGNLVKSVDGRGFPTDFDYSDRFGSPDDDARSNAGAPELGGGFSYAFPTRVTTALDLTTYTQYDYYLGAPVNSEDANGIVSSVAYNDALDRPTQRIQARWKVSGGAPSERSQVTITYDDANRAITPTADRDAFNDNILTSRSYYDGFGRTWRSAAYEGATWSIKDTQFDALGRASQSSNSYRAADPDSASPPSGAWTSTVYDALGRVVDMETPDGAHVFTQYSGNQVTVWDQANKKRRSETNALGRLIKVTEDPGGFNYDTYYSYDALDNLRQVTQGSQTRTFVYDSLSRLISATNPESGTVTYAHDPNGNLIEKTDARGVRTTVTYDALNRVRSKAYLGITSQGTAAANVTPTVFYFYDDYSGLPSGAPNWPGTPSKGMLIGVTYGAGSEGTYYKYDAAGRIVTNHQRQGTSNYATAYEYNCASATTLETRGNPARRRITMSYDEAGRFTRMTTGVFPFLSFPELVSGISYTPFGGLQSETYGNGLIHSMAYNERQQPTEIRLGRPDNLESVFRINYIYGTAHNVNGQDPEITPTHNNGDIARIKYFISGALQYSQTFQYDQVNRLRHAVEHNNGTYNDGARAWYQSFDYDPHGNRGINLANTSDNTDAMNSALQLADFSAANNRIARAGFVYDAAGNLTDEPGKIYAYDGENRIVTATMAGGVTSQYFYDGNGRRVKKVVGGIGTRFEYGAGGDLIVERNDSNGAMIKEYLNRGGDLLTTIAPGGQFEYSTADHLGSPRAWTDHSGKLVVGGRHDYLPFGEELFAGVGARTAGQGFAVMAQQDRQRKQFASHERDDETGLDFMQARYYSSLQGRFTSVDPSSKGTTQTEPQTWNKYIYAKNNPLQYLDKNGKWPTPTHNKILRDALPGLNSYVMKIIQMGSESVDAGRSGLNFFKYTLNENNAPQHAMTRGTDVRIMGEGRAVALAIKEANAFVKSNLQAAKDLFSKAQQAKNDISRLQLMAESFEAFGMATHTVMDNASPAHRPFQIYDGFMKMWLLDNNGNLGKAMMDWATGMRDHSAIESREPTAAESKQMETKIRQMFLDVYGEALYNEAVKKAGEENRRKAKKTVNGA